MLLAKARRQFCSPSRGSDQKHSLVLRGFPHCVIKGLPSSKGESDPLPQPQLPMLDLSVKPRLTIEHCGLDKVLSLAEHRVYSRRVSKVHLVEPRGTEHKSRAQFAVDGALVVVLPAHIGHASPAAKVEGQLRAQPCDGCGHVCHHPQWIHRRRGTDDDGQANGARFSVAPGEGRGLPCCPGENACAEYEQDGHGRDGNAGFEQVQLVG